MSEERSRNGCIIGPGPWCGTSGGYTNHKCRCDACTAAWALAHKAYMDTNPAQREAARARQRSAYQSARTREQNRRSSIAVRRALKAVRRQFPDVWRELYRLALADVNAERGPLPDSDKSAS